MSNKHHRSVAAEVAQIQNHIDSLGSKQIESIYGIIINEDGSVHDIAFNKDFPSLSKWVVFNNQQDEQDSEYDNQYSHGRFDDED